MLLEGRKAYPHGATPENHAEEDYAVISRAFDPETHAMLILVSGCLQCGTEGAARLITNPDLLAPALRNAPKDWQKNNLQLVIEFDVGANSPASSRVVAFYLLVVIGSHAFPPSTSTQEFMIPGKISVLWCLCFSEIRAQRLNRLIGFRD